MTLNTYLDGVLIPGERVRIRADGGQGLSWAAAADGSSAQGGIGFDDPAGSMVVKGWQLFAADETACTENPRLFTGFVGERRYLRGKYRHGSAREIDTTLNDPNVLLQTRRINGGDSLRRQETDSERLAWLLSSGYIPLVSDLGLVNGAGRVFDSFQYKGYFPSDVLADLMGPRGQISFVYRDPDADAFGLFFDDPSAIVFTSPLAISNVLADIDDINDPDAVCFAPNVEASSLFDPSEVISHLRYVYKGAVEYRNRQATVDEFFTDNGLGHRDGQVENERVGLRSTAITFADRILMRSSEEAQSIDLTVRLPATKVGLIQAGHRVFVRLSFVPGFENGAWTRVETLTGQQSEITKKGANADFYDIGLHLSTYGKPGVGGTGGGSTDPFPTQPPNQAPLPVRTVVASGQYMDLDHPSGIGRLETLWITERGTSALPPVPTGWTSIETAEFFNGSAGTYYGRLCWRIADGVSTMVDIFSTQFQGRYTEWPDGAILGNHQSDSNLPNSGPVPMGPITPSGPYATVIGYLMVDEFFGNGITAGPGMTELGGRIDFGFLAPLQWAAYVVVPSPTPTTITATTTETGNEYGYVNLVILPGPTANPPQPGAPVNGEIVVMDGLDGTTAFPFAAGSLRVKFNGVTMTPGVDFLETDPTCGAFVFTFDPGPAPEVVAWYQG